MVSGSELLALAHQTIHREESERSKRNASGLDMEYLEVILRGHFFGGWTWVGWEHLGREGSWVMG